MTSRSEDDYREIEYFRPKATAMTGTMDKCLHIISKEMTSSTIDRKKRGDVSRI